MYRRTGIRVSGRNLDCGGKIALSAIALAVLVLSALPASAAASSYGRTVAGLSFTTQEPARSTGLALSIHYQDAQDPNAKPKTFHELKIKMPQGTHLDLGVVPACSASDSQIMAKGPSACPSASMVGAGTATLTSGFGAPIDPIRADVAIIQGQGVLLDVFSAHGTSKTLVVDHVGIDGSTLIDRPQSTPGGPPDGRSAVRDVKLRIDARTARGGRAYIRTPPSCPVAGWGSSFVVSYDDGVTDTATASAPCSRSAPTIRLSVSPRRLHAGTRARFRFRVHSRSAACRRRVLIRFAGRHVRTNRRGNATLVRRLHGTRRYRAVATKHGCRSGRASVTAR